MAFVYRAGQFDPEWEQAFKDQIRSSRSRKKNTKKSVILNNLLLLNLLIITLLIPYSVVCMCFVCVHAQSDDLPVISPQAKNSSVESPVVVMETTTEEEYTEPEGTRFPLLCTVYTLYILTCVCDLCVQLHSHSVINLIHIHVDRSKCLHCSVSHYTVLHPSQ